MGAGHTAFPPGGGTAGPRRGRARGRALGAGSPAWVFCLGAAERFYRRRARGSIPRRGEPCPPAAAYLCWWTLHPSFLSLEFPAMSLKPPLAALCILSLSVGAAR